MSRADGNTSETDFDHIVTDEPQMADGTWVCDRCRTVNDSDVDFCTRCGADGRSAKSRSSPPPVSLFPSDLGRRRSILDAIASANEKYARPFEQGRVALV